MWLSFGTRRVATHTAFPDGRRQPLLWAALAFAAGILACAHAWRPPTWWLVAAAALLAAAAYFCGSRLRLATALALAALAVLGALTLQLNDAAISYPDLARFSDGRQLIITAHVTRDGVLRMGSFGKQQQSLDAETEEIAEDASHPSTSQTTKVAAGLRLAIYSAAAHDEDEAEAATPLPMLRYGQRVRFSARLRLPRNYGNPGAMDVRGYLARQGLTAMASVKAEDVEELSGFAGSRLGAWRSAARRNLLQRMNRLWGQPDTPLLTAMLIGEQSLIDRETRVNFQRTGVYHILVVSGMNVGILAVAVFWVLRRLRAGEVATTLVTVAATGGYTLLTDLGPPILRATLMLWIYLGARLLYRDRRVALNAIGLAALVLLVADPRAIFDPSFQLTFTCVLAIAGIGLAVLERTSDRCRRALAYLDSRDYDVYLEPRQAQFRLDVRLVAERLARLLPGARAERAARWMLVATSRALLTAYEVLVIALLMQISLALPMAVYFHRAAMLTAPANSVVVPLTEVLMPAAIVAVALSYVSATLAYMPAALTALALHGITGSVRLLAGWRAADLRVATPGLEVIVVSAAAFVLAMVTARRRPLLAWAGMGALVASALWVALVPPKAQVRPGVLEITVLDVGEGDSILVVTPEGRTLLVDAGGLLGQSRSDFDLGEDVVSPYLWSRGIVRLDALALTHAHSDHIGGMRSVLANFHPHELWLGTVPPVAPMQALLQEAAERRVKVALYAAGRDFDFGGATVQVLAPPPGWKIGKQPRNSDSLVLRLSFHGEAALLAGDAEKKIERLMAEQESQADVLKVAHHGSATSTIPELLEKVRPRYAVISVGYRNPFGFPKREVLERLEQSKIATYRTDLVGAVTFYLDGRAVEARLPNRR